MEQRVDDKITQFKKHLTENEKSKATVEKYMRDIYAFSAWLNHRPLSKNEVLGYKAHLMEQAYAPTSINSMLSSLNSFFSYCNLTKYKIKTLKIQRRIFACGEKELSKSEYEKLLCTAKKNHDTRLYLLMQTICSTGIRVSELRFITFESVQKKKATIHLKGKLRMVFLPDDLCKMLAKYAKQRGITHGSIFVSKRGTPLDRSNIWKMMQGLCNKAGVDKRKVFPHNLRHLFARTYYAIQKDIVRLADILGHTSINTTRIYTMETGEMHQRQIQRLGLLRC